MEARETTLSTLLNGRVQYRVPLFQRAYAWQEAQRRRLWADVLELYEERRAGSPEAQHFLGSVVTSPEQVGPHRPALHTLIDGQQRLTTLAILLAALRDHVGATNPVEADRLHDLYLWNQYPQEPTDGFKVLPTQQDRDAFAAVVDRERSPEGDGPIARVHADFIRQLEHVRDADGDPLDLRMLEGALLQGLGVVSITLEPRDNAYRVFESLNATGLALAQVDLIRNLFMMKLGADRAEEYYTALWVPMQQALGGHFNDYVHDYYLKDGTYLRADSTYSHAKQTLASASAEQVVSALVDMCEYADRWLRVREPSGESDPDLAAALASLHRFGSDTPLPFLLNVAAARDRDVIDALDMAQIVALVESFLVRRMFAGVPTNQLNRLFLRLWDQVAHRNDLATAIHEELSESTRRWPDDEAFIADFVRYPLYTDSQPRQRRLVLDRLEQSYGHHETPDLDQLQIEHIVPQTLTDAWCVTLGEDAEQGHQRWLHTPGNLTLTGYNPELSNAAWSAKRDVYAASNLVMTRDLANIETFDKAALLARAYQLAERAITIWPGPKR